MNDPVLFKVQKYYIYENGKTSFGVLLYEGYHFYVYMTAVQIVNEFCYKQSYLYRYNDNQLPDFSKLNPLVILDDLDLRVSPDVIRWHWEQAPWKRYPAWGIRLGSKYGHGRGSRGPRLGQEARMAADDWVRPKRFQDMKHGRHSRAEYKKKPHRSWKTWRKTQYKTVQYIT